ncbi:MULTISPECIES: GNAT family N-acetyltransferase [unclassified Bradyrhizobium]|uniref:GNAT family N-acetyltransferase n=1 Tax=unclassified Bradyrhizobium TaxID=2631580 RepID=UPI0028ECD4BF|nr:MULTISPECIES: GNAT family N-acetyltransferase [unclassified Bradyrhizobium]
MEDPAVESRIVDVFEMRLVDIDSVDLAQLLALSIAVQWPHRAEDWQFMRNIGRGVVALDEIGRALGSAMWFPYSDGFAAVGMVITSPRLQALGTGQWLMRRVMAECGSRTLRLNATRAAYRLYRSLDFKREQTLFQCQGVANAGDARSAEAAGIRVLTEAELPALIDLDAQAYGVQRTTLITELFRHSRNYGLFRSGRLDAFASCRQFGRGHVVGPVVASCDGDAIAVIEQHVAANAGQFLRLDTHRTSGEFRDFLARAGLTLFDAVTTMSLRSDVKGAHLRADGAPASYAVVSQAFG